MFVVFTRKSNFFVKKNVCCIKFVGRSVTVLFSLVYSCASFSTDITFIKSEKINSFCVAVIRATSRVAIKCVNLLQMPANVVCLNHKFD